MSEVSLYIQDWVLTFEDARPLSSEIGTHDSPDQTPALATGVPRS